MNTPIVTICVPTHNRGNFLEAWFEENFDVINDKRIVVIIHDNGSSDNTPAITNRYQDILDNVRYLRSDVVCNFDNSLLRCIDGVETDYFWPIGDTYLIPKKVMRHLLKVLSKNSSHDAIIFNINNRYRGSSHVFKNYDELLSNVAGVNACLATTIYRKTNKFLNLERFIGYDFIHSAILFEGCFGREVSVRMISELSIEVIRRKGLKKRNWAYSKDALQTITRDWGNHLLSLSGYDPRVHRRAMTAIGDITGLFSLRGVLLMRSTGSLRLSSLKLITNNVPFRFAAVFYLLVIISLMLPQRIFALMLYVRERMS